MHSKKRRSQGLAKMARLRRWLDRLTLEEIDDAVRYVEFLEKSRCMDAREAADWRWRIMACWAELQRKPTR